MIRSESKIKVKMFGLQFNKTCLSEAAKEISNEALSGVSGLVITPNVDHIVNLNRSPELLDLYCNAQWILADGQPVVVTSRILYGRDGLVERVTGADLLPELCKYSVSLGTKLFFLGGLQDAAELATINMEQKYSGCRVVGSHCPPFGFESDENECHKIVDIIQRCDPDIIFVCLGSPKQELWAAKYQPILGKGMFICVGAALDFAAGLIPRSPRIIQKLGIEWVWRLMSDPVRLWKRYLVKDMAFIKIFIRELYHYKLEKRNRL